MRDLSRIREILRSGRTRRVAPSGPVPGGVPINLAEVAERLGGEVCENAGGRYVLVRSRHDGRQVYVGSPIADALDGEGLRVLGSLAREPAAEGPVLFVDLETTGLSGGAGTVAFLIGVGFFGEGDFHLNQYVLPSLGAERAQLVAVGELIRASRALVTFNGKSFDVPVMETRWAMHRMPLPWADVPHVDVLHPARRLWRRQDCRLAALEEQVLGLTREHDVPGAEIPARYFGFLRRGDPAPLIPVLEHNRLDLVSLAALTARGCRLVAEGAAGAAGGSSAWRWAGCTSGRGGSRTRWRAIAGRPTILPPTTAAPTRCVGSRGGPGGRGTTMRPRTTGRASWRCRRRRCGSSAKRSRRWRSITSIGCEI